MGTLFGTGNGIPAQYMKDCNNSTVLGSTGYDHKQIKLDRLSPKLKVNKFTKMTPLIYFIE
jgi:hypothetical protein